MTPRSWTAALLLFLAAQSCEVARDLRPELFACDAGGYCPTSSERDSGVPLVACQLNQTCTCEGGEQCSFRCTGSCNIECLTGSNCEVSCVLGGCNTHCAAASMCKVSCTTGSCATTCDEGASCEIDCALSNCTCDGGGC